MLKSVGFHIWSSKMDQMCVFVWAFVQSRTGKCTENKLSHVCLSAGPFKCPSASSKWFGRMLALDFCQSSVHVDLSWNSSAEQGPQANIPVYFSPLIHFTCFISVQIGSTSPPVFHCHAPRAKAWGECWSEPGHIWPPLTGGRGLEAVFGGLLV